LTRHLLCSIGTTRYNEASYSLDGNTYTTRFAPVALARLRSLHGWQATVLATADAMQCNYAGLEQELRESGVEVLAVQIPVLSHIDLACSGGFVSH